MHEEAKVFADRAPSGPAVLIPAFTAFALVVAADYFTSYELSLGAFYVLIILAVSWFCGVWWGGLFAFSTMFAEIQIGLLAGNPFSDEAFFYISNGNRLFCYLLIAYLASTIRSLYEQAQSAARVDFVTGATNSTGFYEKVAVEMERHRRSRAPFSVAYVSCDYFKVINDGLGHREGDRVLRTVAQTLQANLRLTDIVARLGSDEFALILPQSAEAEALTVVKKLCGQLAGSMAKHEWPITFSVGVGVFTVVPPDVDRVIAFCDRLMRRVKALGKNKIIHRVYDPDEIDTPMPVRMRAIR
ncbi:MAG: diguanylate cyclase [Betaproteobacteria bacterium]|nr:diguanylate cyclase [Betaproteobacteria bacterium]